MVERKKVSRGRRGCIAIFIFIDLTTVLPLIAYVLSYGPGVWLTSHGYMSKDVLEVIYAPLLFLGGEFKWIGNWIIWYASFWAA